MGTSVDDDDEGDDEVTNTKVKISSKVLPELRNRSVGFKKHRGAIHINGLLSLNERRSLNAMLFHARGGIDDDVHYIERRTFTALSGMADRNSNNIKTALRGLLGKRLEWNLLDKNGKDAGDWAGVNFLQEAAIVDGLIEFAFTDKLKRALLQPQSYAKLNIIAQQMFRSKYGLTLYELVASVRSTPQQERCTRWFELKLLRELLGAQSSSYEEYKKLKQRVLAPAVEEVNSVSDLYIDMEERKQGKWVTAVRFTVEDNPHFDGPLIHELENIEAEMAGDVEHRFEMLSSLLDHGLTMRQSIEFMKANLNDEVLLSDLAAARLYYSDQKRKGISRSKLAAISVKACREHWGEGSSRIQRDLDLGIEEEDQGKTDMRDQRFAMEQLGREVSIFRGKWRDEQYANLSEEQERQVKDEFFKDVENNPFLRSRYKKDGLKSPWAKNHLRVDSLHKVLGNPTEADFEGYVKARGLKLGELMETANITVAELLELG